MDLTKVARVPPVTAAPDVNVFQAVKIMADHKVGAVVVVDSNRKVLGIFTERDNMMRVTLERRNPESTPLRDVMSSPVQTAAPNISPSEALTRMLGSGYRHLPVVDNQQQIVGMVSVRQLLMRRVSEQHNNIDVLAAYVEAGGPG